MDLVHVLNVLLHLALNVRPGLELHGTLLHGAQQVLQLGEPGLVVALGRSRLIHPFLVLRAELGHLLPLLLGGNLNNVLALELVTAAVDGGLQFVLHAVDCQDLSLLLGDGVQLLLELRDHVRGEGNGLDVFPGDGQLLLVLLLLLLLDDLDLRLRSGVRRVIRRGVVGALRAILGSLVLRALILRVLILGCLVRGSLVLGGFLGRVGAVGAVGAVGGLRGVRLGLLLGDVDPVQLLNRHGRSLDLNDPTGLQKHGGGHLRGARHVVLLPLAGQEVGDASHGVIRHQVAVLEHIDAEVLLHSEGKLLLAAKGRASRVQGSQVLLPLTLKGHHLHGILVRRDVCEEDLLHPEGGAGVGGHKGCTKSRRLLAVEVLPERQLLVALAEVLREERLDPGHTPGAPNDLHLRDVVESEVCPLQGCLNRAGEPAQHVLAHALEGLTLDGGLEVRVLVQGLHNEGCPLVGAEDGLGLLGLREELSQGARVLHDAVGQLGELGLEFLEHDVSDLDVHEVPTDAGVDGRADHANDRGHLAGNHSG
mmetsp:Transcript_53080/g.119622  ORF Transcript_53080/g.119622 Transcript_53080/m.119622 type:complete len:536 (+) Transcript_53080:635-2242(+)